MAQGAGEDIADNPVWQYAEEGSNTEAQEVEIISQLSTWMMALDFND